MIRHASASRPARSVPIETISRALFRAGFAFFHVSTAADWHIVTLDFETCIQERRTLAADVLVEIGYDVAQTGTATLVVGQPGMARVELESAVLEYVTLEPIAA